MNQRVYHFYVLDRSQRKLRRVWKDAPDFSGLTPAEQMLSRMEALCAKEAPHIHPQEKIVLFRSVDRVPEIVPDADTLCEIDALLSDLPKILSTGLMEIRRSAARAQKRVIDAILILTDAYKQEAVRIERDDVARNLVKIPRYPAKTLSQALQFLRVIQFARDLFGLPATDFGSLPDLLAPYEKAEPLSPADKTDLICDFLISLKRDEDLSAHTVSFAPIGEDTEDRTLPACCLAAMREVG